MKIKRSNFTGVNIIKNNVSSKKEAAGFDSFSLGNGVDNLGEQMKSLRDMKSDSDMSRLKAAGYGLALGAKMGLCADLALMGIPIIAGAALGAEGAVGGVMGAIIGGGLIPAAMGTYRAIEGFVWPEEAYEHKGNLVPEGAEDY